MDTVIFNLVFLLGYMALRVFYKHTPFDSYFAVAFFTMIIPPIVLFFTGMYRSWDEYIFAKGMDGIISGVWGSLILLLGIIWLNRSQLAAIEEIETSKEIHKATEAIWGFPVSVLIFTAIVAPLAIWVWRIAANVLEHRILKWSTTPRNIIIVGSMAPADLDRLVNSNRPSYHVLGCLCKDECKDLPVFCLGKPEQLSDIMKDEHVEEVLINAPDFSREELLRIIETAFENKARPRIAMGIYEALLSATSSELTKNMPIYKFRSGGISGWTYVIKRLMDVVFAAIALCITGPFIILPACIAIVIDSKGWPLFTQTRVGLHGRLFKLYKLRTMVIDADVKGGPLTEDDDPRITMIGKFMRKTSIDELPQFWNVLKGDMSFVGPRAVVPYVVDGFQDWERLSLTVRPGVTGLAQVSGRDEIGFREKSLLNLYYVRNHSIWLDLRIIVDTVTVVLSMEGTGGTRGAKKQKESAVAES
ncbi:MAG: sugar transferase [Planctomycetes bacterium]|nr:sugar transferase [Planctomycetota bacterium]